jgi:hypothetical protein
MPTSSSKMDTRMVVTTYSCGHALVGEEDMPPTLGWKGITRQVTTQALHDFKYEDSYHGCPECVEKDRVVQHEEDPSQFAWLLSEARHVSVDESKRRLETCERRPDFLFNVDSPEIEREDDSDYSPFDVEITHSHQQVDISRELPQNRNLLERPLFGDGMKSVIAESYAQVSASAAEELQNMFSDEHASEPTTDDTLSSLSSLSPTTPNFRAISITPPLGHRKEPSDNNRSSSQSSVKSDIRED